MDMQVGFGLSACAKEGGFNLMKIFGQERPLKWRIVMGLALGVILFGLGNGGTSADPAETPSAVLPATAIPPDATPEMKEFLQNQALLSAKMAAFNQAGANGSADPGAFSQFQQQNADLLQRQQQLAQLISRVPLPTPPAPPPLRMSPNASTEEMTILTARDAFMRDQIAFENQHQQDDPATQEKARERGSNKMRIAGSASRNWHTRSRRKPTRFRCRCPLP